jgi:hypothetical protein
MNFEGCGSEGAGPGYVPKIFEEDEGEGNHFGDKLKNIDADKYDIYPIQRQSQVRILCKIHICAD